MNIPPQLISRLEAELAENGLDLTDVQSRNGIPQDDVMGLLKRLGFDPLESAQLRKWLLTIPPKSQTMSPQSVPRHLSTSPLALNSGGLAPARAPTTTPGTPQAFPPASSHMFAKGLLPAMQTQPTTPHYLSSPAQHRFSKPRLSPQAPPAPSAATVSRLAPSAPSHTLPSPPPPAASTTTTPLLLSRTLPPSPSPPRPVPQRSDGFSPPPPPTTPVMVGEIDVPPSAREGTLTGTPSRSSSASSEATSCSTTSTIESTKERVSKRYELVHGVKVWKLVDGPTPRVPVHGAVAWLIK